MIDKRTKICATIGPACEKVETIVEMIRAGMNMARLNFSHGDYQSHAKAIQHIRQAAEVVGEKILIMQDLQGPKIRVGLLPEAGVQITTGQELIFDTGTSTHEGGIIPLDHPELHQFVKPGDRMLIDDGRLEVKIMKVQDTKIMAEVVEAGVITSHKGLNFPDSNLQISPISNKDIEDLKFGLEQGVDFVALSFVSLAEDIKQLRNLITEFKTSSSVKIIAKIERQAAVKNLKEIVEASDMVMVARGDLGLEIPEAEVPVVQKQIIEMAHQASKPVIVATQMLDSMRESTRPTRAEVSDVANAVIDRADYLMLSNETATGKHPVLAVKTMAEIIVATEKSKYDD